MPADILLGLSLKSLIFIIRLLETLSILQCRQVHSKCKSCVDQPAEYNPYQRRLQDIIEHYRSAHDAKQHRWIMESPSKHFHIVCGGDEVDHYLFLQPFRLSYPKAMSCVSVIRKQGKASCVNDLCLHEVSSMTPSLLVQRLGALCALLGWKNTAYH